MYENPAFFIEPRMDTNVHLLSTEYTEETECLADVGQLAKASVFAFSFQLSAFSSAEAAGLRLLGGASRFAQAKTTSCGSLKSMFCCSAISMRRARGFLRNKHKKR